MGNSALMYAAHNDNSHCANELLEHGADITATNVAGSSAFSIAVTRGSKQGMIFIACIVVITTIQVHYRRTIDCATWYFAPSSCIFNKNNTTSLPPSYS